MARPHLILKRSGLLVLIMRIGPLQLRASLGRRIRTNLALPCSINELVYDEEGKIKVELELKIKQHKDC